MEKYVIKKGDTLSKLAKAWNCTINDILKVNPTIINANKIYEGKVIIKPSTIQPDLDDEVITLLRACVNDIQNLNSFKKLVSYLE